mmetsp:Transcript_20851/g.53447  ORF Transcript_20851/g.53447 Transcript_20851/m.53447 type:complete len:280 (+) Transcript_20851:158-997(+)
MACTVMEVSTTRRRPRFTVMSSTSPSCRWSRMGKYMAASRMAKSLRSGRARNLCRRSMPRNETLNSNFCSSAADAASTAPSRPEPVAPLLPRPRGSAASDSPCLVLSTSQSSRSLALMVVPSYESIEPVRPWPGFVLVRSNAVVARPTSRRARRLLVAERAGIQRSPRRPAAAGPFLARNLMNLMYRNVMSGSSYSTALGRCTTAGRGRGRWAGSDVEQVGCPAGTSPSVVGGAVTDGAAGATAGGSLLPHDTFHHAAAQLHSANRTRPVTCRPARLLA